MLIAAVLAASGALLPACAQQQPTRAASPRTGPVSDALVFATPGTRLALANDALTAPSESWAASRYDRTLAVRTRSPLLATEEWPEPLPPPERPVWFHRWVQH